MPRVVHLTTVHHPSDPRVFWKEAVSAQAAGFDVFLVVQHEREETVEGVDLVPLPLTSGRYQRVFLQRRAFRTARALQASVYHFHDPELIPLAWALKRATGARMIYDMHEDYRGRGRASGRLLRALERWCFTWADHVVLAEESYAAIVPEATPHTVILNYFRPFHQQAPSARAEASASFRLLSTGTLSAERGVGRVLDIVAQAHRQALPWHVTLAGKCYLARDRRAAEQQIMRDGLETRVRRVGWETFVPWPMLEPEYVAADVGLALFVDRPNYARSVPTKFYEYLFYGLPILCSDFPLWRQFVERHQCGAVVAPGDHAAAFKILKQWYEQPALYHQLSEAAANAAPQYLWPVMEKRLVALYARLVGLPGGEG